ncbi:MAG: hypothetical protein QG604_890 [Candidatus Dependentiae bacterium]|nr:hypothetical protein [Candidatus Dependentiae bacterium]
MVKPWQSSLVVGVKPAFSGSPRHAVPRDDELAARLCKIARKTYRKDYL